ncbi:MAG: hypothetical protein ABI623_10640, partial [bacterium]
MRYFVCLFFFVVCCSPAQQKSDPQSIAEKTKGMEKHSGFIPYYWDAKGGKIYIEVNRWGEEFL